ncbi:MAG: hypothetical protein ACOZQL_10795 [Myxococcota bacterium]
MSALKSLPEAEACGWYVRTKRTAEDGGGFLLANFGAPEADHFAFGPEHGSVLAAITAEAVNATRETGIGPAEMRRQRDELLEVLRGIVGLERRKLLKDKAAKAWVGAALDVIARAEGL